jgi:hypothetical protein
VFCVSTHSGVLVYTRIYVELASYLVIHALVSGHLYFSLLHKVQLKSNVKVIHKSGQNDSTDLVTTSS